MIFTRLCLDAVKKYCRYYDIVHPVFSEHMLVRPIVTSADVQDHLGPTPLNVDVPQSDVGDDVDAFATGMDDSVSVASTSVTSEASRPQKKQKVTMEDLIVKFLENDDKRVEIESKKIEMKSKKIEVEQTKSQTELIHAKMSLFEFYKRLGHSDEEAKEKAGL